jgi:hypothetical protein
MLLEISSTTRWSTQNDAWVMNTLTSAPQCLLVITTGRFPRFFKFKDSLVMITPDNLDWSVVCTPESHESSVVSTLERLGIRITTRITHEYTTKFVIVSWQYLLDQEKLFDEISRVKIF